MVALDDGERLSLVNADQQHGIMVFSLGQAGAQGTQLINEIVSAMRANSVADAIQHVSKIEVPFRQAAPLVTRKDAKLVDVAAL